MARFNRINVGGHSDTVTLLAAADSLAGNVISIQDQPAVVFEGYQQGLGVDDSIPAGNSIQAGLLFSGDQYAIRAETAGDYVEGDALELGTAGQLVKGTTEVIAYAKETATLIAGDLLLVRIK